MGRRGEVKQRGVAWGGEGVDRRGKEEEVKRRGDLCGYTFVLFKIVILHQKPFIINVSFKKLIITDRFCKVHNILISHD